MILYWVYYQKQHKQYLPIYTTPNYLALQTVHPADNGAYVH